MEGDGEEVLARTPGLVVHLEEGAGVPLNEVCKLLQPLADFLGLGKVQAVHRDGVFTFEAS